MALAEGYDYHKIWQSTHISYGINKTNNRRTASEVATAWNQFLFATIQRQGLPGGHWEVSRLIVFSDQFMVSTHGSVWWIDELSFLCLRLFVAGISLFSTLKEIPGECRPTTWFIGGIVALVSFNQIEVYNNTMVFHNQILSVVATILCKNINKPDHHGGVHLVNLHLMWLVATLMTLSTSISTIMSATK